MVDTSGDKLLSRVFIKTSLLMLNFCVSLAMYVSACMSACVRVSHTSIHPAENPVLKKSDLLNRGHNIGRIRHVVKSI